MAEVTLREVTGETVRATFVLGVAPGQEGFVAANAISIAEAYFEPKAWFRAIYADEEPVGFVMLYDDPATPEYFLWRLMIDGRHQGRGYGRRALDLLVDYVRTRPAAAEVRSSYVPGEAGPGEFYRRYGFEETGELNHGQHVIRLAL